jgi:hypothetical protein
VALDSESGAHCATVRVSAASLNALKFSKDGETVAAAASNGIVYLYKVGWYKTCFYALNMQGSSPPFSLPAVS